MLELRVSIVLACALTACSDDPVIRDAPDKEVCLMRRDGVRYCIEVYEASRKDASMQTPGEDNASPPRSLDARLPWVGISWASARTACESKGKRLCARDEWIDACDGGVGEMEGTTYTYGNDIDSTKCNTDALGPESSGARETCESTTGTFDQSGNIWEWTGNVIAEAVARGGGYRSTMTHACKSGDGVPLFMPNQESNEVGFRCCR